ncbi:MAG: FkbM family methyltransferase [Pirellulales bacterium]|nr:FkbM family methyltransferase [Pirellulales bacterium]
MLLKRFNQFRKLLKVLGNSTYRSAFRRAGVAAATEHEALLRHFNFATVVDVGANRGQFSLVSRQCFPQARILAFEPLASPAKKFETAINADPLVTLHRVAIGAIDGTATIHISAADDSSSLLPITELQQTLSPGTHEVATEPIAVVKLDSQIDERELKSPSLLKIDVQGFELSVLQGSAALLQKFSNIYVECSFVELYEGQALADEVINYLRDHGFNLCGVYNVSYDSRGKAVQADFLFSAAGSGST